MGRKVLGKKEALRVGELGREGASSFTVVLTSHWEGGYVWSEGKQPQRKKSCTSVNKKNLDE